MSHVAQFTDHATEIGLKVHNPPMQGHKGWIGGPIIAVKSGLTFTCGQSSTYVTLFFDLGAQQYDTRMPIAEFLTITEEQLESLFNIDIGMKQTFSELSQRLKELPSKYRRCVDAIIVKTNAETAPITEE